MSFVFNVSKGKVAEYAHRVDSQDPSTSRLVVVAINSTATEATLKDLDTLALVIADVNTVEVANTGYARLVLDNTAVTAVAPDDTNDWQEADADDFDFGVIDGDDVNWTHLLVCYDADVGGGTDADIVPMTCHDFARVPDGSQILVTVNGFFRAT